MAMIPYLAWKLALQIWLGPGGVPANWLPAPYPFAGLVATWPWGSSEWVAVLLVAEPALLVAPLAAQALQAQGRGTAAWILALNLLWLVVFLPRDAWNIIGAARLSDGVVLAAVLCVPFWTRRQRTWFLAPGLLWCLLTPVLLLSLLQTGKA